MLCLSDASEADYADTLILKAVKRKCQFLTPEHVRAFTKALTEELPLYTPFVTCFCENGNLLSQWRGYGGSGAGFALGFSRLWLSTQAAFDGAPCRLQKVIYSPDDQQRLIHHYLEGATTVSRQFEVRDTGAQWFWSMAARTMGRLVVAFKDPVFTEENEWRLVSQAILVGERGYRQSGHRIVPYASIPIKEDSALTSLIRGPYFVGDRGSAELLGNSGFHAQHNIRDSKIPLRR
jgi:hypothetical protein